MDLKKRLKDIAEFLKPYQKIWENEIMLMYPDPLADYPPEWIEDLIRFKDTEDQIRLERRDFKGLIQNPSLLNFYERIEELCQIDHSPQLPDFPETPFSFLYVIPKKQHEIKNLAPIINDFYVKNHISSVVDIGGGFGLLAQSLVNHYPLKVISLDMDQELQATGKNRHEKNAKDKSNKVNYQLIKIDEGNKEFQNLLRPQMMSVGLHTCGPLAIHQIKASQESGIKGILNFGCCYHKLAKGRNWQNISRFAQSLASPIEQNVYSLTLASRAHRKMNKKDYDFKLRVKLYRYAIHFLLIDEYGQDKLISLGNTAEKIYNESFAVYAQEQFQRIKLHCHHSPEELNSYFANEKRIKLIHDMLAAGLIRNALGRLLEIYLLLDRAIYLEEQGYEAKLMECFDESISPRNIGVLAQLKS